MQNKKKTLNILKRDDGISYYLLVINKDNPR